MREQLQRFQSHLTDVKVAPINNKEVAHIAFQEKVLAMLAGVHAASALRKEAGGARERPGLGRHRRYDRHMEQSPSNHSRPGPEVDQPMVFAKAQLAGTARKNSLG